MNQHIFITARAWLNPRWMEAFDSVAHCPLKDLNVLGIEQQVQYWLDISLLAVADRAQVVQQVCALYPRLVVMTDELSENEAFKVMQAGAAGYCHYLAAPEQLREIAAVVSRGGLWLGAQLMQRLLTASSVNNDTPQNSSQAALEQCLDPLTSRERMVALEVGRGASNREIATRLDITERTVKAHISAVFEKLRVRDRVQLALLINDLSKKSPPLSFSSIAES